MFQLGPTWHMKRWSPMGRLWPHIPSLFGLQDVQGEKSRSQQQEIIKETTNGIMLRYTDPVGCWIGFVLCYAIILKLCKYLVPQKSSYNARLSKLPHCQRNFPPFSSWNQSFYVHNLQVNRVWETPTPMDSRQCWWAPFVSCNVPFWAECPGEKGRSGRLATAGHATDNLIQQVSYSMLRSQSLLQPTFGWFISISYLQEGERRWRNCPYQKLYIGKRPDLTYS